MILKKSGFVRKYGDGAAGEERMEKKRIYTEIMQEWRYIRGSEQLKIIPRLCADMVFEMLCHHYTFINKSPGASYRD